MRSPAHVGRPRCRGRRADRGERRMTAVMGLAAGALALMMLATWALSLRLRDASIVDVAWGLAFVLVAWIAVAAGDGDGTRRVLVALLTTVWGLRLGGYLRGRQARHPRGGPPLA